MSHFILNTINRVAQQQVPVNYRIEFEFTNIMKLQALNFETQTQLADTHAFNTLRFITRVDTNDVVVYTAFKNWVNSEIGNQQPNPLVLRVIRKHDNVILFENHYSQIKLNKLNIKSFDLITGAIIYEIFITFKTLSL